MLETKLSYLAQGVQVHRVDDDLIVIWDELLINRMMEGPGLQGKIAKNIIHATFISY